MRNDVGNGVASPLRGLVAAWRTVTLVGMALLGAAVLVALIMVQGAANEQRDRALALQSHSYDVMILSRSLSATIARAEASLGRYVISTDKQQGQLYADNWSMAGQQIDRLDAITQDNSEQQPRIDALRAAYRARGSELSKTALTTAYKKNDQALSRYFQAGKSASLASIDRLLNEIIARERLLLDHRTSAAMRSVERSAAATRVLTVFGVLIGLGAIVMGWITVQAQYDRATARAEAEEERERAEVLADAVTQATEELRTQEARLRQVQKMEAVGQLTGGIAHDFNNMLAVVLGGLELARRNVVINPGEAIRLIDSATEGADRAAALTRRLLAFAREEAYKAEPIIPGSLIAGMSDLLDRALGDGITVEVRDAVPPGWAVLGDRVALENAVLNLAVNARDAMDGRGQLTIVTDAVTLAPGAIGANEAGDFLSIAVRDDGCGMPPEVIERVFEPFFTTKAIGKGTGLGLSQIFGLVRQLGGEIGIVSAIGVGTTVTLYLPRHSTTVAPPAPVAEPAGAKAATGPRRLTVLVVEDDPRVLAATSGALEELGHDPIACDDPLAAPALLEERHVDLLISDVLMPGQTGPEMVGHLLDRHPTLAVLFVTGFAGEAGNVGDFAGRHVLRKPFTLAKLERAIADAIAVVPERIAAE